MSRSRRSLSWEPVCCRWMLNHVGTDAAYRNIGRKCLVACTSSEWRVVHSVCVLEWQRKAGARCLRSRWGWDGVQRGRRDNGSRGVLLPNFERNTGLCLSQKRASAFGYGMRQQTGDAAGSEQEKENSGQAEGEWFGARVRHGSGGRVEFGWSRALSRNTGASRVQRA